MRNFLTISAAERIFKRMILPTLDYCDIVWQGCGQGNCDSLERLQRRAAKQIHPNSGIEIDTLSLTLKLVLLTDRRKAHTSILVKKCLIGFVPPYFLNYFKLNESRSFYKTRDIMDISLYQRSGLKWLSTHFIIQELFNLIACLVT